MPRAKLTLTIPEDVWIGDLSRRNPKARFRILAAIPGDDTGVGLIEVSAPDLATILEALETEPEITELEPLQRTEESLLVQFETTQPLLLAPMQGSGVPIELPFDITNGKASWEVTAPQKRLSALGEQLSVFGIEFTVDHIYQQFSTENFLTEKQYQVLSTAVDAGYYNTPRECTLTEVANVLDIAKSTCSEILHRAEGKIIKRFMNEDIEHSLQSTGAN